MNDSVSSSSTGFAPAPSIHLTRLQLGAYGEELAVAYLERRGYRVLARNWRNGKQGELDIVADDHGTVVAVEVKTRTSLVAGHPLEAITTAKARRLRRLLVEWMREHRPRSSGLRIDAVGIILDTSGAPRFSHLQGVA